MPTTEEINKQIEMQNAVKEAGQKALHQFSGGGDSMASVDTSQNINENLKSAVQNQANQGNVSEGDIANKSMEGTDQSGRLANPQSMMQASQGLGGNVDQGMQSAISNRQNKLFETKLNEMQNISGMEAKGKKADKMMAAQQALAQQEEMKTQAANTQMVKYQNDVAQRNSVLNSVLGLVGGAVGGIVGAATGLPVGGMISGLTDKLKVGGKGGGQEI